MKNFTLFLTDYDDLMIAERFEFIQLHGIRGEQEAQFRIYKYLVVNESSRTLNVSNQFKPL